MGYSSESLHGILIPPPITTDSPLQQEVTTNSYYSFMMRPLPRTSCRMGYLWATTQFLQKQMAALPLNTRPDLSIHPTNDQATPISVTSSTMRNGRHRSHSLTSDRTDWAIPCPLQNSFDLIGMLASLFGKVSDDGRPTSPTLHSSSLTTQRTCDDYRVSVLSTGKVASRYPR